MGTHTVLNLDGDLGVAVASGVFLSMFNAAPTEARLDKLLSLHRRNVTAKHIFITLIDPRAGRDFSPGARKKAVEVGEALQGFTLVNVYVVLMDGFRGAAARSALAGVLLLQRKQVPWKVTNTVAEGVEWLQASGYAVEPVGVLEAAAVLLAHGVTNER